MNKDNNVIEEIRELVQEIKNEYQEGIDFEFVAKDLVKRATGGVHIKILSSQLKKFCHEKFSLPQGVNNLDYEKGDQEGTDFYYRVSANNNDDDYDTLDYGEGEIYRFNHDKANPKKCKGCGGLTSYEDGQIVEWNDRKTRMGPNPNIIAYFHTECAKKYFANKEQPNQNDNSRIKEKLLRNLDKISIENCGYLVNAELVKNYEETEWYFRKGIFGDDNNLKWKAWWDKVQKVEIEGEEIDLEQLSERDFWEINQALVNEIKQNPSEWKIEEKKHIHWTEEMVRHQKSGQCHWRGLSILKEWIEIKALINGSPVSVNNQNKGGNQISNTEKEQIRQYFLKNNVKKIKFENKKLIITHNNNNNETKDFKEIFQKSELLKIMEYCQNSQENKITSESLGLGSNNNTNLETNKNNHQLVIGLALGAGAVILIGAITYFIRKRNKNNGKS